MTNVVFYYILYIIIGCADRIFFMKFCFIILHYMTLRYLSSSPTPPPLFSHSLSLFLYLSLSVCVSLSLSHSFPLSLSLSHPLFFSLTLFSSFRFSCPSCVAVARNDNNRMDLVKGASTHSDAMYNTFRETGTYCLL